jgi:hypothetical protein
MGRAELQVPIFRLQDGSKGSRHRQRSAAPVTELADAGLRIVFDDGSATKAAIP